MKYKMLAIDLDDTLLNDQCRISPRVKSVLQEVQKQGIMVTLATGRMYRSAQPFAEELAIDIPLITYQGALVKTALSREVLYHRPVPLEIAREVVRIGEEMGTHINLYLNDSLYIKEMTPEAAAYAQMARVPVQAVGTLSRFMDHEPTKILFINDADKLSSLWREMQDVYGENLYITKSKPDYLEFLNPQATKGQGLLDLAGYLGIKPTEIMAFGDSYNDLELFRQAGFSVAMGNARDEVKKAADYVTSTNNEDGVAEAIKKLFHI